MENIIIGSNVIPLINKNRIVCAASSVVIITDDHVANHWLQPILEILKRKIVTVIIIRSGENNKTLVTLKMIWNKMLKGRADRSSVVVTLGGGVVCDIGGFAAATFMRGLPVIHIPTTLLAQVDAGVGGKTAINFGRIKNCIGVFHQPTAVIIDVQTLKTLPHRQLVSGISEIIKHAIIADSGLLKLLLDIDLNEINEQDLIQIIKQSIGIKTSIVKKDEKENNGIRKQLNFGHTVGHAVESLSLKTNNELLHGEAVAIGMIAETHMSFLSDCISKKEEDVIKSVISHVKLPSSLRGMSVSAITEIIKKDKKNNSGKILWSLPLTIGKVKTDMVLTDEIIRKGILSIINMI